MNWQPDNPREQILQVRNLYSDKTKIQAERKLAMIDAAATIEFLRSPPGNRLERLRRDRVGQWSVRINAQWRVCFHFADGNATSVEIVDYH